jgi:hypothetical protein
MQRNMLLFTIGFILFLLAIQNAGFFGLLFIAVAPVLLLVALLNRPTKETVSVPVPDFEDDDEDYSEIFQPKAPAPSFCHEIAHLFNVLTPHKAIVTDNGDIGLFKGAELVSIARCVRLPADEVLPSTHIRELNTAKQRADLESAYLVTTVRVSDETKRAAAKVGIKVIDSIRLKELQATAKGRVSARQTV